ncbi:Vta1 like-domain-containing protein [Naematelia encephala]|uniref:Vta1 like-domain-containing protein n=1 Tax=Naematelia encephala TaxID=71784 RepID=A0A1Y2AS25_9TREE|nr:Vta1 like-domain-containing protein [Naematelia encephala]
MEAVAIPSENVPGELKTCEQILKRAKELKKAEPVVAYWCCFSAAQKALSVSSRSKEGTIWLMSLLDALEQMKALLGSNEAVTNEAAGAAYIENFALKVFMSADNDDRNGVTGKGTIRKFVVAGQFIEVLRCFENGMTEEMEQKLQYARWKAADGAKALREGRTPQSGPPISEPEFELPQIPTGNVGENLNLNLNSTSPPRPPSNLVGSNGSPSQSAPAASPLSAPKHIDDLQTPKRTNSSGSGAWSTVATPGLPDSGEEPTFNLDAPNISPSAPPPLDSEPKSPTGERKNVRFMGPDGAPLSPATTHITVDSYDAPDAPPPTTVAPSPTSSAPLSFSTTRPRGDSASTPKTIGPNPNSSGPTRRDSIPKPPTASSAASTSIQPPPAPPPSLVNTYNYPSAPPQPHTSTLGLTSPLPPTSPPKTSLTRKETEQTQKHAKWAVSALDYDDLETARNELKKALAILGG